MENRFMPFQLVHESVCPHRIQNAVARNRHSSAKRRNSLAPQCRSVIYIFPPELLLFVVGQTITCHALEGPVS